MLHRRGDHDLNIWVDGLILEQRLHRLRRLLDLALQLDNFPVGSSRICDAGLYWRGLRVLIFMEGLDHQVVGRELRLVIGRSDVGVGGAF